MSHTQDAKGFIELATRTTTESFAAIAQAHATLALAEAQTRTAEAVEKLVEQQRIATIAALGMHGSHGVLRDQVSGDAAKYLTQYVRHSSGGYFELSPEVMQVLGVKLRDGEEVLDVSQNPEWQRLKELESAIKEFVGHGGHVNVRLEELLGE